MNIKEKIIALRKKLLKLEKKQIEIENEIEKNETALIAINGEPYEITNANSIPKRYIYVGNTKSLKVYKGGGITESIPIYCVEKKQ